MATEEHKLGLQKELANIAVFWVLQGDRRAIYSKKNHGLNLIEALTRPMEFQDILESCIRINEN